MIRIALIAVTLASAQAAPKGLWLTPRKDATNQARADVPGDMTSAPDEVWRMPTGGSISYARDVTVDGRDAVLVQVGTTLQLLSWRGEVIWQELTLGIGTVFRVDDFDNDGGLEVLARTNVRTAVVLSVATGEELWRWEAPASTQVIGHAFRRTETGLQFIVLPSYSTDGYCFDFSGSARSPKLVWQQSYAGKYGVGYGPSVVLADMDRDDQLDVVISGKVPSIYHAVLDIETGAIKFELNHMLDGWGRPYGLLHATDLDADGYPDIVMISCQVEEYIGISRNIGGERLEPIWGQFIEKDYPEDHKELRPQVTSVADLTGDGKQELVIGLFDEGRWRTLVIDPMVGFGARRGEIEGCFFWGCHDITGDGLPEVIVSKEAQRRPGAATTLLALDGKTLEPIATLEHARIFASGSSDTPMDRHFMAVRSNPVEVEAEDGMRGILVSLGRGSFIWGAKSPGEVRIRKVAAPDLGAISLHDGGLILSDARGGVQRFTLNLEPWGRRVLASGRGCVPLVWEVDGRRELVVDTAGRWITGGAPVLNGEGFKDGWKIAGAYPALHVDPKGTARLAAVGGGGVQIHTAPIDPDNPPVTAPLAHPTYGSMPLVPHGTDEYRVMSALQTGVHTGALAVLGADGQLIWEDTRMGAYPNTAGAGDLDGDGRPEVVADDHGALRVFGPDGAVLGTDGGWPPAYSVPVIGPFGADGAPAILRSSGINGMSLITPTCAEIWKFGSTVWKYYKSIGAVGDIGEGRLGYGILNEDGALDCIDTRTGELIWSVELGVLPSRTMVVAGDVDGDGKDEFVTGLADGRLVCVSDPGEVLWEKQLGAAVTSPIIADVDGDGLAEIICSTSDGLVRILR